MSTDVKSVDILFLYNTSVKEAIREPPRCLLRAAFIHYTTGFRKEQHYFVNAKGFSPKHAIFCEIDMATASKYIR